VKKLGGNNNFPEIGAKFTETAKIMGEIQKCQSVTKKNVIRNFCR